MKFASINGARIAYAEGGETHSRTIVTLHGGRGIGTHESDYAAYQSLTDEFRLLSYDMRGHGESSNEAPLTFAQLVEDLEALRRELVGGPMILLGGSFGGMIAQAYAVEYSANLTHLILRGTAASTEQEDSAFRVFRDNPAKAPMASEAMLRRMFAGEMANDDERRLVQYAISPLYEKSLDPDALMSAAVALPVRAATHNALYQDGRNYDVRPELGKIECPTLVVCGELDWICPPDQSQEIADAIPESTLMVVPGANHAVHRQAADVVLPAIRDFCA